MISKYLLLIFIPTVYSRISIKINAGETESDASVEFSGQDIAIISDTERESFNIGDERLRQACGTFAGREPTDVFVKRPTPWEDVYRKFKWPQVQRVLKPVRSRVMGVHTEPSIVTTKDFLNTSPVKAKYNTGITYEIEETVTNCWTLGKKLTVGQEISYSVSYAGANIGGTTKMSFESNWANDTTRSKAVTIGTSTSVEVELQPGQSATAALTATHGTLELEVDYEAHLIGGVFANYHGKKFHDHNWWLFPIDYVLQYAGMPNNVTSTEKISIGFYTSATVEVRDRKVSSKVLRVAPATIIGTVPDAGDFGNIRN